MVTFIVNRKKLSLGPRGVNQNKSCILQAVEDKKGNTMPVTIYHNPRCSKSRATLEILKDQDIKLEIIEYLKSPPSVKRLKEIVLLLDYSVRDILRSKEKSAADLNLNDPNLTDDNLLNIMIKNPILIERPIVLNGRKAIIGRPPENVLKIL